MTALFVFEKLGKLKIYLLQQCSTLFQNVKILENMPRTGQPKILSFREHRSVIRERLKTSFASAITLSCVLLIPVFVRKNQ